MAKKKKRRAPVSAVELLSQPRAYEFLGIGKTTWFQLKSAGELPEPVAVPGRSNPYWRRSDLQQWAENLKTMKRSA